MSTDNDPVFCRDCSTAVRIERDANNRLVATCGCGESHPVRVASVLPEGWSQ